MNVHIPLSLYIHLPWCIKKCPYCDFNSYALEDAQRFDTYIEALCLDLMAESVYAKNRSIISIFFGGGTPSLFSPKMIETILNFVHQYYSVAANVEITMEANPGTAEYSPFRDYRSAGINRISIGAQSFQDEKLKALGRVHLAQETTAALNFIDKVGFNSFNIDLMYGLPQQSLEDALFDLNTALRFSPPHLSWYHLTLEPNTVFYKHPPVLPEDNTLWEIQSAGHDLLRQQGFHHYEISAYAKPQQMCRHNLNYWQFGDYIGVGAGAHGKLSTCTEQGLVVKRTAKKRVPKSYLVHEPDFNAETKIISTEDLPFEFMLNALRLSTGFEKNLFETTTGLNLASIAPTLTLAEQKGLLQITPDKICPTPLGKRFLNDLMQEFLGSSSKLIELSTDSSYP